MRKTYAICKSQASKMLHACTLEPAVWKGPVARREILVKFRLYSRTSIPAWHAGFDDLVRLFDRAWVSGRDFAPGSGEVLR